MNILRNIVKVAAGVLTVAVTAKIVRDIARDKPLIGSPLIKVYYRNLRITVHANAMKEAAKHIDGLIDQVNRAEES